MLEVTKKYILSFPKNEEKNVLKLMKKDWQFEIVDNKEEKVEKVKELQDIDHAIFSVDFAISYLSFYSEKESILEKIKNPKILVEKEDVFNFKKDDQLDNLIKRVIEIEKDLKEIEKNIKDQENYLKELDIFGDLNFVPKETKNVFSFVLKIDKQKEDLFKEFCFSNNFSIREINKESSKIFYSLIGLKEKETDFISFLEEIKGEIVLYAFNEIPKKEKKLITDNIENDKKRKELIKQELTDLAKSLKKLRVYHDILCLERRQLEVKKRSLDSRFLNYIVFFASEEEKEGLRKELPEETRIVESELAENETPPVYMRNSSFMEPFESVTNIFGLPSHKELDPTPYLSIFFIIFFGICITDAGYGLLLALFTGLALVLFKERFGKNKLIKLLFYGGISTFIAGVLFGSYFGVGPEKFHLSFMNTFKVIDPIKDTILFMGVAFFLGFIQICFSQVVKMIRARRFNQRDEFLSGLAWLSLFVFAVIYYFVPLALIGLIISLIGLFFIESKGQKLILKPLVGGVKILQGLINTMSDILSYSRLMALGLGTGVIALIVNQIAFLLGGMIPYVGWILTGLILVGGHLFNLGINALGGFIHSARLQFVEFFPKFMEGGGKRLDPLGQELKYIKINN
jgi:V/A-type H+-transporting ATPase subunit I